MHSHYTLLKTKFPHLIQESIQINLIRVWITIIILIIRRILTIIIEAVILTQSLGGRLGKYKRPKCQRHRRPGEIRGRVRRRELPYQSSSKFTSVPEDPGRTTCTFRWVLQGFTKTKPLSDFPITAKCANWRFVGNSGVESGVGKLR